MITALCRSLHTTVSASSCPRSSRRLSLSHNDRAARPLLLLCLPFYFQHLFLLDLDADRKLERRHRQTIDLRLSCRLMSVRQGSARTTSVLFCSLAILDPRVGHTMDVFSPFISIQPHTLLFEMTVKHIKQWRGSGFCAM